MTLLKVDCNSYCTRSPCQGGKQPLMPRLNRYQEKKLEITRPSYCRVTNPAVRNTVCQEIVAHFLTPRTDQWLMRQKKPCVSNKLKREKWNPEMVAFENPESYTCTWHFTARNSLHLELLQTHTLYILDARSLGSWYRNNCTAIQMWSSFISFIMTQYFSTTLCAQVQELVVSLFSVWGVMMAHCEDHIVI